MATKKITIDEAVPDLASTWLAHYRMALLEGLGARPSGAWTRDPHAAAAAVLTTSNVSSFWPSVYGGTAEYTRNQTRWSATRRACLSAFEHGIRLGLSAPQAARAMRKARGLGRTRLGIHKDDMITIEKWLDLTLAERDQRVLSLNREQRWNKLLHQAKYATEDNRPYAWVSWDEERPWMCEWVKKPLSAKDQERRRRNLAKLLADLVGAASW